MSRIIVKLDGKAGPRYLEWSTVVDAPVTFGMTLEEFRDYYRDEYGRRGMAELERRLARVEAQGSSAHEGSAAEDVIAGNRAGPNDRRLSRAEIYRAYCLREPIRKGWVPAAAEEV